MADQNNEELMIQLPWTVPQQPLYTAQIQVNSDTNKIPLDLTHSTDMVAVGAIVLSFFAFVVTIFIVKSTTKAQIKSNIELIENQVKQKYIDQEIELFKISYFDFRKVALEFLEEADSLVVYVGLTKMEYAKYNFSTECHDIEKPEYKIYQNLQIRISSLQAKKTRLNFEIYNFAESYSKEMNEILGQILLSAGNLNNSLLGNEINLKEEIATFKQLLRNYQQLLKKILVSVIKEQNIK